MTTPEDELHAEVDYMRDQLEAARVAMAKAEAERDAAVATSAAKVEAAERVVAVATSAAKVEAAERVVAELRSRADRLEAALAEARKPLVLRVLDGLRRRNA